jgi:TRAP-type C4-dicarboxylate transport system permease small subunit
MQPLNRFDKLVTPLLSGVAAIILFVMMMLTCCDVIGRYFLNAPVYGAFEMTELLLACLIFTGLPLVTLRQEHICVDVLDGITPDWMLRILHIVASFVAAVATSYLAWRLCLRGANMLAAGETTAQLKLPLGYLATGMSVLMAVTAVSFFILIFRRPSRQSTGEV